jgi:hypothetical protein
MENNGEHDEGFAQEKRLSFATDKAAYNALPPRQQRLAARIAAAGFGSRTVVVTVWKTFVGVTGRAFDFAFLYPYRLAAKLVRLAADGAVRGLMFGIDGITGAGRGLLATARGALAAGGGAVKLLYKAGLLSQEKTEKFLTSFTAARDMLLALRDGLVAWGRELKKDAEDSYTSTKDRLIKLRTAAFEFLEYYGALGLYRGTRWLLDPRTKSGAPLLGNERLNRAVGFAAAAVGFVAMASGLLQLGVLAKVWHIKLAHSLITDTAPVYINVLKQAPLHVLITGGVTALKFFGLPPLAATRHALKSLNFTRAVAYQYNDRLRKAHDPDAPQPKGESYKSFGFLERFVEHVVVEKAAPEFYEARLKYYQEKMRGAFRAAAAPQPQTPKPDAPKPEQQAPKPPPPKPG